MRIERTREADDASVHEGGEGSGGAAGAPDPAETGSEHGAIQRVAAQLGYGVESVRNWVKQADIDDGEAPGTTTEDDGPDQGARAGGPGAASGERDLEVGVGFLRGGARPPTEVIVEYIDEHRDEFGVEPICRVLQVAPSTYYAAKTPAGRPSARAGGTR